MPARLNRRRARLQHRGGGGQGTPPCSAATSKHCCARAPMHPPETPSSHPPPPTTSPPHPTGGRQRKPIRLWHLLPAACCPRLCATDRPTASGAMQPWTSSPESSTSTPLTWACSSASPARRARKAGVSAAGTRTTRPSAGAGRGIRGLPQHALAGHVAWAWLALGAVAAWRRRGQSGGLLRLGGGRRRRRRGRLTKQRIREVRKADEGQVGLQVASICGRSVGCAGWSSQWAGTARG